MGQEEHPRRLFLCSINSPWDTLYPNGYSKTNITTWKTTSQHLKYSDNIYTGNVQYKAHSHRHMKRGVKKRTHHVMYQSETNCPNLVIFWVIWCFIHIFMIILPVRGTCLSIFFPPDGTLSSCGIAVELWLLVQGHLGDLCCMSLCKVFVSMVFILIMGLLCCTWWGAFHITINLPMRIFISIQTPTHYHLRHSGARLGVSSSVRISVVLPLSWCVIIHQMVFISPCVLQGMSTIFFIGLNFLSLQRQRMVGSFVFVLIGRRGFVWLRLELTIWFVVYGFHITVGPNRATGVLNMAIGTCSRIPHSLCRIPGCRIIIQNSRFPFRWGRAVFCGINLLKMGDPFGTVPEDPKGG